MIFNHLLPPIGQFSNQFMDDLKKLAFVYKEVLATHPHLILNDKITNTTLSFNEISNTIPDQCQDKNTALTEDKSRLNKKGSIIQQLLHERENEKIKRSNRR